MGRGGKETTGRNKGRWENNIKMDAQEIEGNFMDSDGYDDDGDDDDDDDNNNNNDKDHLFICRV